MQTEFTTKESFKETICTCIINIICLVCLLFSNAFQHICQVLQNAWLTEKWMKGIYLHFILKYTVIKTNFKWPVMLSNTVQIHEAYLKKFEYIRFYFNLVNIL